MNEVINPDDQEQQTKGRFSIELRNAINRLRKDGLLSKEKQSDYFLAINKKVSEVSDFLADSFLDIIIDHQHNYIFLAHTPCDEAENRSELTRNHTFTLIETLIVISCRKKFQEDETTGKSQSFIHIADIETALSPYVPLTMSSKIEIKKIKGVVKRLSDRKLLKTTKNEDRFQILPSIRYVINAEELSTIKTAYEKLIQGEEINGS